MKMKTSYTSEHPLLERKRKKERKTLLCPHTQEGGSQDTESRNARLKDHKMWYIEPRIFTAMNISIVL